MREKIIGMWLVCVTAFLFIGCGIGWTEAEKLEAAAWCIEESGDECDDAASPTHCQKEMLAHCMRMKVAADFWYYPEEEDG